MNNEIEELKKQVACQNEQITLLIRAVHSLKIATENVTADHEDWISDPFDSVFSLISELEHRQGIEV